MTETEIKEIVQKQRSYFYTGATLPVEKRLDALKKLKTCIQKYEPLINEALKSPGRPVRSETQIWAGI